MPLVGRAPSAVCGVTGPQSPQVAAKRIYPRLECEWKSLRATLQYLPADSSIQWSTTSPAIIHVGQNNISDSPRAGIGAGQPRQSLALGVTAVDPSLFGQRVLSSVLSQSRKRPTDIDIDIESDHSAGKAIQYCLRSTAHYAAQVSANVITYRGRSL